MWMGTVGFCVSVCIRLQCSIHHGWVVAVWLIIAEVWAVQLNVVHAWGHHQAELHCLLVDSLVCGKLAQSWNWQMASPWAHQQENTKMRAQSNFIILCRAFMTEWQIWFCEFDLTMLLDHSSLFALEWFWWLELWLHKSNGRWTACCVHKTTNLSQGCSFCTEHCIILLQQPFVLPCSNWQGAGINTKTKVSLLFSQSWCQFACSYQTKACHRQSHIFCVQNQLPLQEDGLSLPFCQFESADVLLLGGSFTSAVAKNHQMLPLLHAHICHLKMLCNHVASGVLHWSPLWQTEAKHILSSQQSFWMMAPMVRLTLCPIFSRVPDLPHMNDALLLHENPGSVQQLEVHHLLQKSSWHRLWFCVTKNLPKDVTKTDNCKEKAHKNWRIEVMIFGQKDKRRKLEMCQLEDTWHLKCKEIHHQTKWMSNWMWSRQKKTLKIRGKVRKKFFGVSLTLLFSVTIGESATQHLQHVMPHFFCDSPDSAKFVHCGSHSTLLSVVLMWWAGSESLHSTHDGFLKGNWCITPLNNEVTMNWPWSKLVAKAIAWWCSVGFRSTCVLVHCLL